MIRSCSGIRLMLIAGLLCTCSCEEETAKDRKAADYGVTEPGMAALVIRDTSPFVITTVVVREKSSGNVNRFDGVPDNQERVYAIAPGRYDLFVSTRCEERDIFGVRTASADCSAPFEVSAGHAVLFVLKGGALFSTTYESPTLEQE